MRSKFDEQLALMKNELIQMGALCEEAISLAAKSLNEGNKALAEKAMALDTEIDQYFPESVSAASTAQRPVQKAFSDGWLSGQPGYSRSRPGYAARPFCHSRTGRGYNRSHRRLQDRPDGSACSMYWISYR